MLLAIVLSFSIIDFLWHHNCALYDSVTHPFILHLTWDKYLTSSMTTLSLSTHISSNIETVTSTDDDDDEYNTNYSRLLLLSMIRLTEWCFLMSEMSLMISLDIKLSTKKAIRRTNIKTSHQQNSFIIFPHWIIVVFNTIFIDKSRSFFHFERIFISNVCDVTKRRR